MTSPTASSADNKAMLTLYAAGFGACAVGLQALGNSAGDNVSTVLTLVLLACGFYTSWLRRRREIDGRADGLSMAYLITLPIAIGVIAYAMRVGLFAMASAGGENNGLGVLIVFVMMVASFRLRTDLSVAFMCIPAFTLINLSITYGSAEDVITYFAVYLMLACLTLVQQNLLSARHTPVQSANSHWSRVGMTGAIAAGAIVVGAILGLTIFPYVELHPPRSYMEPPQTIDQFTKRDYASVQMSQVFSSDQEVLTVQSPEPVLLRGEVFQTYTGHGWAKLADALRTQVELPRAVVSADRFPMSARYDFAVPTEARLATKPIKVTVRPVSCPYQVVYGVSEPTSVSFTTPTPISITASDGQLNCDHTYGVGAEYTVVSSVSSATPAQLRAARGAIPYEVQKLYTDYPFYTRKVKEITDKVIEGKTTAYDKAMAIQDYLRDNCIYDLNAPVTPLSADGVTHFLYVSKRGYCQMFATAMAVMCRQAGIPARWVTGFAPGEYNEADGKYHLRFKDMHAWTELYFPKYGWVTFDPTPGGDSGFRRELTRIMASIKAVFAGTGPTLLLLALLIVLAVYLIKTELLPRLSGRAQSGVSRRFGPAAENYHRMCRTLSRHGYPRRPEVTPSEYVAALRDAFPPTMTGVIEGIDSLTSDFLLARYSTRMPSTDRVSNGATLLERISAELRTARRRNTLPRGTWGKREYGGQSKR